MPVNWLFHHVVYRRVDLELKLEAITPLRVGAAFSDPFYLVARNPTVRVTLGDRRLPFIPGTTLKGALRAGVQLLEMIEGRRTCGHGECFTALRDELDSVTHDDLLKRLCTLCKIFGAPGYRSHVFVGDAYPEEPEVPTFPKQGVALSRTKGGGVDRRLYDFEIVPSGTRFNWKIEITNLPNRYLSRILGAVYLMHEGILRIGGLKSRGLGWLRIRRFSLISTDMAENRIPPLDERDTECRLDPSKEGVDALMFAMRSCWGELP